MTAIITILATVACTLSLGSISILCRYSERSLSRCSLMLFVGVWSVSVVCMAVGLIVGGGEPLNFGILVVAYMTFMPLVFYLISLFCERVLEARNVVALMTPAVGVVALSFVWQMYMPAVFSRVLMLLVVTMYVLGVGWFVGSLTARLKRIDRALDFRWIWVSGVLFLLLFGAFVFNLFCYCYLSLIVYIVVGILGLMLIVDNAMLHRAVVLPRNIVVEWRFPLRWQLEELDFEQQQQWQQSEVETDVDVSAFELFSRWLNEDKPYCKATFSIKDVESKFASECCMQIMNSI